MTVEKLKLSKLADSLRYFTVSKCARNLKNLNGNKSTYPVGITRPPFWNIYLKIWWRQVPKSLSSHSGSGGPVLTRAFHVQGAQLSRHLDLELKINDKLNFSVAPTDSFLRFLSTQCSLQFSSLEFCPV